jgi:hypothetical protein
MIGVLTLIGRAANNPMRLIGDVPFRHSRICRPGLIPFLIVRLSLATPRSDGCKPARNSL